MLMLVLFLMKNGTLEFLLGQKLFNAKVFYRFFLGATSRDFFYYIKVGLYVFIISRTHFKVNPHSIFA